MADEHLTQHPFALAGFNGKTRSSRPRLTLTRLILLVTLLLALIGGLGYWQVWRLAEQLRTAVLTELSGSVEVWTMTNGAWQLAVPGLVLHVGDKVRTGAAATARITYFDGSLTRMSASTTLELTELSARRNGRWQGIAFNQESGQTEQLVLPLPSADSRFEITTAAARIAVQGAAYQVMVDEDDTTHVTVIEGQVVVYDGQNTAQTIAAGDSLILTPVTATGNQTVTRTTDELTLEFTPTATASPTATTTPSATTVLSATTTLIATFTPTPTVTATVSPTPGSGGLPTLTPRPTFPPTLQPTPTNPPPPTSIPPGDNDNDNDNDDDDDDDDND